MENLYNQDFTSYNQTFDPGTPNVPGKMTRQALDQYYGTYSHPNVDKTYIRDAAGSAYKQRGSYDTLLMPDQVQAYVRGENQSVLEQGFNGVINLVPSVGTKLLGGAPALIGGVMGLFNGNGFVKGATENIVSKGLRDFSEYVNENILPVHKTRDYYEGNAIDRLSTTSWLFNDFADGAAFAISAYLTGRIMGAIIPEEGLITQRLAAANMSRPMLKAVTGNLAKGLNKTKEITGIGSSHILTGAYNTIFEASAEAHDARVQTEAYWNAAIYKAKANGASPQEIQELEHTKELRSDAAMANVFTANAILLAFTNTLFEAKWALGEAKTVNEALERGILQKSLAGEAIDPVLESLIKKPNLLSAAGKGILNESYIEENFQAAFQSLYTSKATDPNYDPKTDRGLARDLIEIQQKVVSNAIGFTSNLAAALIKGVSFGNLNIKRLQTAAGSDEDEASQAMFAALGISGPMSAKAALREYKQELEYGKKYGKYASAIAKFTNQSNKNLVDNITSVLKTFKYTDENGNVIESSINPTTGKQEIDPDKFANLHRRINNIMDKHKNAITTAAQADEVGFEMNKDQALFEYAYDLYTYGKQFGGLKDHELDEILKSNPLLDDNVIREGNEQEIVQKNRQKISDYFKNIEQVDRKYSKLTDNIPSRGKTIDDVLADFDKEVDKAVRRDLARTEMFLNHKKESLLKHADYLNGVSNHTQVVDETLNSFTSDDQKERYKDLVEYNVALEDLGKGEKSITAKIIKDQISRKTELSKKSVEYQLQLKDLILQKAEAPTEAEKVAIQKKIDDITEDIASNVYLSEEQDALDGLHAVEYSNELETDNGNKTLSNTGYSVSDIGLRKIGAQRIYNEKYRQEHKVAPNSVRSDTEGKLIAEEVIDDLLQDLVEKWNLKSKFNFASADENTEQENMSLDPEQLEEFINDVREVIDKVKAVSLGNAKLLKIAKSLQAVARDLRAIQDVREILKSIIKDDVLKIVELHTQQYMEELASLDLEETQEYKDQLLSDFLESIIKVFEDFGVDGFKAIQKSDLSEKEKAQLFSEIFNLYNNLLNTIVTKVNDGVIELPEPVDQFIARYVYDNPQQLMSKPEAFKDLVTNLLELLEFTEALDIIDDAFNSYIDKINAYETQVSNIENFLELELNVNRIQTDISDVAKINANTEAYNIEQASNRVLDKAYSTANLYYYIFQDEEGKYRMAPRLELIDTLTDSKFIDEYMGLLYNAHKAFENRKDLPDEVRDKLKAKITAYYNVFKELKKAVSDNEIKLDRKNQQYLNHKINALLRTLGVGPDNDKNELTPILTEILKSVNIDYLVELTHQQTKNSLSSLIGLISLIRNTATKEQLEKINSALDLQVEAIYNKLTAKYSDQFSKIFNLEYFKYLVTNPSLHARFVVNSNMFNIWDNENSGYTKEQIHEIKANPEGAYFQILEHNNFLEALNALEKDTLLTPKQKENLKNFIEDVLQVSQGLYDLKMQLTSPYSYTDLYKAVEEVTSEQNIQLSQQQFASLIDLVTFMVNDKAAKGDEHFGNSAIFTGVLGSGKSTVAAIAIKVANKLNGKTDNNHILATGHVEVSSEAINKKINPTSTENRKLTDLERKDLEDKSLLIVDEAFAISNADLVALQTLVESINKTRDKNNKLKILFVGDMSQNRSSEFHILTEKLIDEGDGTEGSSDRATLISPLATTYRTTIDSIALAFTAFRDKIDKVQAIEVTSTISSLDNYTPNALGVIQNTKGDITSFLANRDTTRSAVLIVNTREEATKMIADITDKSGKTLEQLNLTVLAYTDVQSITRDESYVFLNKFAPTQNGGLFTEKSFNTAMYTSIGRASKFVVIGNSTEVAIKSKVTDVDDSIDISEGIKENLKIAHLSMLDGFQDGAERYFGAEKKERKSPDSNTSTETFDSQVEVIVNSNFNDNQVEEDENSEIIPISISPLNNDDINIGDSINNLRELGNKSSKFISLKSVNNSNINKVLNNRTPSDKIKAKIVKRYKGREVLVSVMAPDANGMYHEVAVLTSEELHGQFAPFLDDVNNKNEVISNLNKDITEADLAQYSIADITISYISKAHYDNSGTEKESNFSNLLQDWAKSFLGDNWKELLPDTMYNKSTNTFTFAKNHNQVSILTRALYRELELDKRGFKANLIGLPILRIKNYRKDSVNPQEQFVILNVKEAHTVDGWYDQTIKPIQTFYTAYKELKDLLDSLKHKRDSELGELFLGNPSGSFNTDLVDAFARQAYTFGVVGLKTTHIEILKKILQNKRLGFFIDKSESTDNLTNEELANIAKALDKVVRLLYNEETSSQLVIESTEFEGLQKEFEGKYQFKIGNKRKSRTTKKEYYWIEVAKPNVDNAGDSSTYEPFKPKKLSLGNSDVQKAFNKFAKAFGSNNFAIEGDTGYQLNNIGSYKSDGITTEFNFPKTILSLRSGSKNSNWSGRLRYLMRWIILDDDRAFENNEQFRAHAPSEQEIAEDPDLDLTKVKELLYPYSYNNPNRIPIGNDDLLNKFREAFPEQHDALLEHVAKEVHIPIVDSILAEISNIKPGQPIKDSTGRTIRAQMSRQISSIDLSKKESRQKLESNTTNKFVKVIPNNVSIDIKESTPQQQDIKEYLQKKVVDNEQTFEASDLSVLNFYDNPNTYFHYLYSLIKPFLGDVKVIIVPRLGNDAVTYTNTKGETIIALGHKNLPIHIILHEAIHAVTIQPFETKTKDLTESQKLFRKRIKTLMDAFNKYLEKNGIDPATVYQASKSGINEKEFIANLTKPEFIAHLKKATVNKESLLKKFINAILELFGVTENDNKALYDLTYKALEDFLNKDTKDIPVEIKEDSNEEDARKNAIKENIKNIEDRINATEADDSTIEVVKRKLKAIKDSVVVGNLDEAEDRISKLNRFNFATDDSTPSEEYSSAFGVSIYQLTKIFGTNGAANRAIFYVKKHLYLALNDSDSINNLEIAREKAFGEIQYAYSRLYNDFLRKTAKFKLEEVSQVGENTITKKLDIASISDLDKRIEQLRNELKNIIITDEDSQDAYDYAYLELKNLVEISNTYRFDLSSLQLLKSDIKTFNTTINYIYKNWNKFLNFEEDTDSQELNDDSDDNEPDSNLRNEIQKNETVNIIKSFSVAIKNYLGLIPVYDNTGDIVQFVYVNTAITKMAEMLHDDIDFFSIEDPSYVIDQLDQLVYNNLLGPAELAVVNRFKQTLQTYGKDITISKPTDEKGKIKVDEIEVSSTLPNNYSVFVNFFEEDSDIMNPSISVVSPVDYQDSNIDIRGLSAKEAVNKYGDRVKVKHYKNIKQLLKAYESNNDMLKLIKDSYNKHMAYNDLSNIRTYLGSLQRALYMQSKTENDYYNGKKKTSYTKITPESAHGKSKDKIASMLLDFYNGEPMRIILPDSKGVAIESIVVNSDRSITLPKAYKELISNLQSSNPTIKEEAVISFLNIFGLRHLLNGYSNYGLNKGGSYRDFIKQFAQAVLDVNRQITAGKLRDIIYVNAKSQDEEEFNTDLEYRESLIKQLKDSPVMTSRGGFLNLLEHLHKVNSDIRNMATVKNLQGKNLPEFVPTSFAAEALKDFLRFKKLQADRNRLQESKFFNHPFFSKNIFINGISTIYQISTKHNTSQVGNYIYPAEGNAFGTKFNLQMNSAFLAQIATTDSYYQPIFQQGEATKALSPKVKFLNFHEIRNAFDTMLQQLLNIEPELTKDKSYKEERLNFSLYNKAKALIPHNTEDLSNKELRDKLIKVMMKEAFEETKKIVNRFKTSGGELTEESKKAFEKILWDKEALRDVFGAQQSLSDSTSLQVFNSNTEGRTLDLDSTYYEEGAYFRHNLYQEGDMKNTVYPADPILDLMMYSYVLNNYVNSFGLSQLILGDFNMYGDIETLVKRAQMSASPGYHPIIDKRYGISRYANVLITPDAMTPKSEYAEFISNFVDNTGENHLDRILNTLSASKDIERTDGVMFITPRYFEKLQRSFGSGLDLKNVIKDQAFGWTEQRITNGVKYESLNAYKQHLKDSNKKIGNKGLDYIVNADNSVEELRIVMKPLALKNAMIVLSDEFLKETQNSDRKHLIRLRTLMDDPANQIDMLAYKSATKIGAPKELYTTFNNEGEFNPNSEAVLANAVKKLDMSLFKIQYNPHSTSKTTALPRQMLYFASALNNNPEVSRDLYGTIAHLESVLQSNKFDNVQLSKSEFTQKLKTTVKKGDENFAIINALEAGISIDHPAIANIAINALGSNLNNTISKLRTKGGKLVLQSDIGVRLKRTNKNGQNFRRKLKHGKTRNGTPYAEVILPKHYLSESHIKAIESGKSLFLFDAMFGFRIPTGELNSGMLLRVVDFYESDNSKSNIAIMPDLEIMKQGWDFDVDSLFIMTFEDTKKTFSLRSKDQLPIILPKDSPIGFPFAPENNSFVHGSPNFEEVERRIIYEISEQNKEIAILKDKLPKLKIKDENESAELQEVKNVGLKDLEKKIERIENEINDLKELRVSLLKNRITYNFIALFNNKVNNSRIVDITSTKMISDAIEFLIEQKLYNPERLDDLSFVDQNIDYYQRVNEASKGRGIYAKGSNVSAYLENNPKATPNSDYGQLLSSKLKFKFNSQVVDAFNAKLSVFGTDTTTYNVNSNLLNGFLDALKNPEIFNIGFSGGNANLVDVGLSLKNIPFEAIVLLFNHPDLRNAFKNKQIKSLINKVSKELKEDSLLQYIYDEMLDVTTEDLKNAYKTINSFSEFKLEVEEDDAVTVDEDIEEVVDINNENQSKEDLEKSQIDNIVSKLNEKTSNKDVINYIASVYANTSNDSKFLTKVYRRLSKQYHPDVNPDSLEVMQELVLMHEDYTNTGKRPLASGDYSSVDTRSTQERFKDTVKKNLNKIDPYFKMLMLLHKIYRVAEEKQKFIPLVNIAADKPVSISQIFEWEEKISKLFEPEVLELLKIEGKNLFNNHKGLTTDQAIMKQEEIIDALTQMTYEVRKAAYVKKKLPLSDTVELEKLNTLFATSVKIDARYFMKANPHLTMALMQTLVYIENIKKEFVIYSDAAYKIVEDFLPVKDSKNKTEFHAKTLALNALADMLISSNVEHIYYTAPIVFAKKHTSYQGIDAFTRKLAAKLDAISLYESKLAANNPKFKANLFLKFLISVERKPFTIKAVEANNIQNYNAVDYYSAFKELAYYNFTENYNSEGEFVNYTVSRDFVQTESVLQKELVDYAIFKYGMRPAANNYVALIAKDFIQKKSGNIANVYNTYVLENKSIGNVKTLYNLYAGLKYPSSLPRLSNYSKQSYNRGSEEVQAVLDQYFPGIESVKYYDKVITGENLPEVMVYGYKKSLKGTQFYVAAKRLTYIVYDDSGRARMKWLTFYKKLTFGEFTLPNKVYDFENHFRLDLPTLAVKPNNKFDMFSEKVINESGEEVVNTYSIPFDEKYHSNIIEHNEVYAYQIGDILRKRLTRVEVLNKETAAEDRVLKLRVVSDDVNKQIENKTQVKVNKENKKGSEIFNSFHRNQQFIDLNIVKIEDNDVFVYSSNNKNIPNNKQSKLAFYSNIEAQNSENITKVSEQFDYAMSLVNNELVQGTKQQGYGIELFKLTKANVEYLHSENKLVTNFENLFNTAINNPKLTFKFSIPNSYKEKVATAILKAAQSTTVPKNIQFNSNLVDEISKQQVQFNFASSDENSTPIKEGVLEVFATNNKLSQIGTPQQYSQYIDSIFPDSQVKNITYHVSNSLDITIKNNQKFYSTSVGSWLRELLEFKGVEKIPLILNITNPTIVDPYYQFTDKAKMFRDLGLGDTYVTPDEVKKSNTDAVIGRDSGQSIDEQTYITYQADQVHILGSKQDIQGFKEWVSNNKSESLPIPGSATRYVESLFKDTSILDRLTSKENIDKAEEIKKNCEGSGGLTAESGLTIGFTPGSKWSLVKDLKGPSHAQGGIDLSIDNGKVMYSDGNTKFHAADGLVLPSKSTNPTANRFPIVDQIKQEGIIGPEIVITAPKRLNFNATNEKSSKNEIIQLQMHLNNVNGAKLKVDGVYGPKTRKAHDEGFLVGIDAAAPVFKPNTLQDENRNVRLQRSEQNAERITKQNAGIANYPAIPEIKNPKGTLNFQNYGNSFDCKEKQCGEFVQNEIYRAGNFSKTRKETIDQLGIGNKNAWEFSDALISKGGKSIYESKQSDKYIETPQPGDIVSVYTGGRSPYQKAANKYEMSTGRGTLGDTHVGIITKVYPDGSYDINHNVHKKAGKDEKGKIIYKGNASTDHIVNNRGEGILKSWIKVNRITRPNYESLENKGLSIDPNITLQTSAKNKHITETVSQFNKNKSSIGNYLKLSDKDLMPIAKAALGILEQESNYGQAFEKGGIDLRTPYEEAVKIAKYAKNLYKLTKGEIPNEVASEGSGRIKYSQHFTDDDLRRMQSLTNVNNPEDNYGSLVATMSILTKNYKKFIKKGYNEEDALYRAITNHNSPSKAESKGKYTNPENDVVSQYNSGYTNKILFYANKFNIGTKNQKYSSNLERLATKKEVIENTKNLTLRDEN